MAKLFQVVVPNEDLISRIINSGNQVHELMVIERADKKFVADHSKELEKPALYILVNRDSKKLYVGETDDSIKRLRNHAAKDFWTEAIVFHSTTETLSTTEVKWLEAKTYKTIADLGFYDLSENKVIPQFPKLKKYQELDLEPIFQEAKGYICAAGFDFFLKRKDEIEQVIQQDLFDLSPVKVTTPVITEKQNTWLICYDKNFFNVEGCFKKLKQIYWQHKSGLQNVKKGDIAYLYSSSPESAVRFKVEVIESQLPYSAEMEVEKEFMVSEDVFSEDVNKKFFLVRLIAETNSSALKHASMQKAGIMGKRPSATKLSKVEFKALKEYIEQHFDELAVEDVPPVVKNKDKNKAAKPQSTKRRSPKPPFKFSMIDLKPGDKVVFDALHLEVTIASDKTIIHEGKEYSLTTFCKEFLPKEKQTKTNTYQGPDFFSYKGKKLTKIRKEKENNSKQ